MDRGTHRRRHKDGGCVMLKINVKVDGLKSLQAHLRGLEKQLPFATAKALTQTAKKAQARLVGEMKAKFSNPTDYTLDSTFVKPAQKRNLTAVVGLRDRLAKKAHLSMAETLAHHFTGGDRAWKKLEVHLNRAGLIGRGEYVVPGAGATLDAHGNMNRGQIAQIMSQLRLGLNPQNWSSKSRRSRRNVTKAGRIFWARGNERDRHLRRGAWIDMGGSVGLRPLLIVVKGARYRRRFDLERMTCEVVAKEWPSAFGAALADAMATAKR